ncbi:MAG: NAD(P)-binding protein [Candidatus Glassbacteria bacterium]|nr:NAD(P)-binding protein [Candidatus Glassbacteria bacterium]
MSPERDKDKRNTLPEVSSSTADMQWNRTGDWSFFAPVYTDRTAPCAVKCPLKVPVNNYMHLVNGGSHREAWEAIVAANPLPSVTGRVCYHDCEGGCNRREFDDALNIHGIERFLGDTAIDKGWDLPAPPDDAAAAPVAILGSGPAGLGCAYALRMAGYPVEIYERENAPGGMLRVGVPEFRMPRKLLDAELTRLERIGVRFRCGENIEELESIRTQVLGVFLASGAHGSREAGVEGADLDGVHFGLDYLKAYNGGTPHETGGRVAVIGGGNTSLDVARASRRLGAEVDLYYRRTEAEMPAHPEELEEARAEGVRFHFQVAPEALLDGSGGRVARIRMIRMEQGRPDESGRARPVPVEGSGFEVEAATVVFAIGERPELGYLGDNGARAGGCLAVDGYGRTGIPGVFAGGDIVPGENSVSHALADGIAAGRNMAAMLQSYGPEKIKNAEDDAVPAGRINFDYFSKAPRLEPSTSLSTKPSGNGETSITLEDSAARDEAGRCFNCGTCVDCDICLVFCPDLAIYCREGSYLVRTEYCKGCGICAEECPRGVISMEKKDK